MGKPLGHQGLYSCGEGCSKCTKNYLKKYIKTYWTVVIYILGAVNIWMKYHGSQGNCHIIYYCHLWTFFFFFLEATKAGSGAEGEAGTGGEVTDPPPHPCGLPGAGLAACIRRAEASSYYDNDGTLPSMCAAHWGAKLSLIYMGALSHLEYLQIDRFAVAKFRLGYRFKY